MQIVTLINDWKQDPLYAAQLKGKLVSKNKELNIIDLISNILNFDIVEAAFVLKKSFTNFPEETIHLNFVDNPRIKSDIIIAEYNGQFFVSRDNGFLSLALPDDLSSIFRIENSGLPSLELDTYSEIVDAITKKRIQKIAAPTDEIKRTITISPGISAYQIIGHVIYIDVYGNLITDITSEIFDNFRENNKFKIYIQSDKNYIDFIGKSYADVECGDLVAFFNSLGLLEIGQRNGNIAEMFGIAKSTEIRIEKIIENNQPPAGLLF